MTERQSPAGQGTPEERLSWLRKEIRRHEDLYYIHDRPEITDTEFDALLHELEALEAQHPDLVTADSPTQRVAGRPTASFPTVAHLAPMFSLDNAYDEDDLRAFDERLRRAATRMRRPPPAGSPRRRRRRDGCAVTVRRGATEGS